MSEADMSKGSIKKIHKTADKIKDKPKAKKSIGKWAKDRGMDPEGAIYAIATNMRKRKEGKKIDPPGRESYSRNELPQIKEKHLQKLPHTMETIAIKDIVPVQSDVPKLIYYGELKDLITLDESDYEKAKRIAKAVDATANEGAGVGGMLGRNKNLAGNFATYHARPSLEGLVDGVSNIVSSAI